MAASTITLWGTPETFVAFAVTKAPEPAHEWDEAAGRPSAAQMMRDGTPVWSAEALCGQGWAGDVRPVNLRILSATRPTLTVDPMKIAALYAPVSAASASASPSHAAPSSSSSSSTLPRRTA